jgi:nitroreductase
MNIPANRWYPVIETRRSRRQFDASRPVPEQVLKDLKSVCDDFRPFSNTRAMLITQNADEIFKGVIGAYGKVKDAPAGIAFIGNMTDANVQEKTGYTGEGIILEATALGLATCWVGGFFKPEVVTSLIKLEKEERILAVTPAGYAVNQETLEERVLTGFGNTHKRKPISNLVTGLSENEWPEWIRSALEAARLAPSAVNRQPWGFHIEPDAITVSVRTAGPDFNVSKRLDCGIAMLHIEVAAMEDGVNGKWQFLDGNRVARFKISSD